MELIRQRVENLKVKSPIDGELVQLNVELGQSIGAGQKVGQINDLSDFKIQATPDEHYLDKVHPGLDAKFERQSRIRSESLEGLPGSAGRTIQDRFPFRRRAPPTTSGRDRPITSTSNSDNPSKRC